MPKRATLKDVARRSAVTYQTVSKILRGSAINVTPEVRARVEQVAREMGYVPNVTARSLRERSSHLIGYSWQLDQSDTVNPILELFLHSIVDAAESAGYHILLFPQRPSEHITAVYDELARTGRVDGFVLSGLNYDDPRIAALQLLKVPFVAFGRSNDGLDFPYVDVDNHIGMRLAVEHLMQEGHTRIALIAWPENSRVGSDRLEGYLGAMRRAGLPVDPGWVVRVEGDFDFGYRAALGLLTLAEERRPTAIAAVADQLAIGAMRAVQERGLAVGRDVAVTGFDDTPIVGYLQPALTSLRQPIWEIGRLVVTKLVGLLEQDSRQEQNILLAPTLIIRESSVSKMEAVPRY